MCCVHGILYLPVMWYNLYTVFNLLNHRWFLATFWHWFDIIFNTFFRDRCRNDIGYAICEVLTEFGSKMGTWVGVYWHIFSIYFWILYRKGVFEHSLARFGIPFGSFLIINELRRYISSGAQSRRDRRISYILYEKKCRRLAQSRLQAAQSKAKRPPHQTVPL